MLIFFVIVLIIIVAILFYNSHANSLKKLVDSIPDIPSPNSSNRPFKKGYGPLNAYEKYRNQVIQEVYNQSKDLPGKRALSYEKIVSQIDMVEDDIKSAYAHSKPPVSPEVVANYILGSYLALVFTYGITLENPDITKEDAVQYGCYVKDVFNSLFALDIYIRDLSSHRISMDDLIYAIYVMYSEEIEPYKILEFLKLFDEYISFPDFRKLVEEHLESLNVPVEDLMPGLLAKMKHAYYFGLSNSGTFLPDITPPDQFALHIAGVYFKALHENLNTSQTE